MNVALVLLVISAVVANFCCRAATVYTCTDSKQVCEEGKPGNLQDESLAWFVDTSTFLVEYGTKYKMISIASPKTDWAVGRDEDGLFMLVNSNTSSVLLVYEGTAYVLHPCIPMQFKTPYTMWTSWLGIYEKEAEPFLKKIAEDSKLRHKQGFNLKAVLGYLRQKGTVKGAPCFYLRHKLEQDVIQSFGDVLNVLVERYKTKMATVADKEGGFYATVLNQTDEDLYKWIAAIVSNNFEVDDDMVDTLYEGTSTGDTSIFKKNTDLYEFAMYLYETLYEAMEAYNAGQFSLTRLTKSDNTTKYFISLAKDSSSGNWVIKICTSDGKAETYVMYNNDSWTFYCAMSNIMMLFPKGDNYGLYNYCSGVGIAVCKKSGMASIFSNSAGLIRKFHNRNQILLAINSMVQSIQTKKINYLSGYTFMFSNFVRTSHMTGSVWPMMSSFRSKMMLNDNFRSLSSNMKFIKDYCEDEQAANLVLYFFKYADLRRLKFDYVGMAAAVGVRQSLFFCKETLSDVYTCALENYKM